MQRCAPSIEELRSRIREIEHGSTSDAPRASRAIVRQRSTKQASAKHGAEAAIGDSAQQQRNRQGSLSNNDFSEEKAFRKIERLACMREHASKALQARLEKDGFQTEVAQAAIARAQCCGLISDERFADVLVRSRLSQGRGLQGIAAELSSLDIDPYGVSAYLEATEGQTGPDELARALTFLDAKPPKGKRLRDSAYRKLMQKGYGASVSASAARIWSEEHETGYTLEAEFE